MPDIQQAITAIKSGDKATGKQLLIEAIKADQRNETAWLWMTQCVGTDEERLKCLQNVLRINPNNETAKRGLTALQQKPVSPPKPAESPKAELQAKEQTEHQATKQCLHCGETITAEAKFCPSCGGKQEIGQHPNEPSKLAVKPVKLKVEEPLSKPVEEIDLKKVNAYVVKTLDEFGMEKWGIGKQGCLFMKGKMYCIFYQKPEPVRSKKYVSYTCPRWIILYPKGEVVAKGPRATVCKYPGYEIRLNYSGLDPTDTFNFEPFFVIEYGGYKDWALGSDGGMWQKVDDIEASETALRGELLRILINGNEPKAITCPSIEIYLKESSLGERVHPQSNAV